LVSVTGVDGSKLRSAPDAAERNPTNTRHAVKSNPDLIAPSLVKKPFSQSGTNAPDALSIPQFSLVYTKDISKCDLLLGTPYLIPLVTLGHSGCIRHVTFCEQVISGLSSLKPLLVAEVRAYQVFVSSLKKVRNFQDKEYRFKMLLQSVDANNVFVYINLSQYPEY
jgi:hypothetical protein